MYRKFKADKIFTGSGFTTPDQVLIVSAEGIIVDLVESKEAGDNIEIFTGIISPGFINCHCHLELSHLKNFIPQNSGLIDFLLQVMSERFKTAGKEFAIQQAITEQYQGGTVALGDICNTADTIEFKKARLLEYVNFIEVSGFIDATAEQRLSDGLSVAEEFVRNGLQQTIVPHAPYSVSKTLFGLINNITKDQIISIHNQEESTENDLFISGTGNFLRLYKSLEIDVSGFQFTGHNSFKTWRSYFTKGQKILSVHNTFFRNEERLAADNVTFCICINSNLYIENKLPPLYMLKENNYKIVLGTDSYASNTQLNLLHEINSVRQYFPDIAEEELLQWATKNGAEALGIDKQYGTFEKGKKPGVVLIETSENPMLYRSSKRLV